MEERSCAACGSNVTVALKEPKMQNAFFSVMQLYLNLPLRIALQMSSANYSAVS
jgi:hypothetical protein